MGKEGEHESIPKQSEPGLKLSREVAAQAKLKLKARRNPTPGLWFGMGMMGIVGWSISIPTLIGIALGLWMDKQLTDGHSWTLALMMAGLTLGCFNAWHWVAREDAALSEEETALSGKKTALNEERIAVGKKKTMNRKKDEQNNDSDNGND